LCCVRAPGHRPADERAAGYVPDSTRFETAQLDRGATLRVLAYDHFALTVVAAHAEHLADEPLGGSVASAADERAAEWAHARIGFARVLGADRATPTPRPPIAGTAIR